MERIKKISMYTNNNEEFEIWVNRNTHVLENIMSMVRDLLDKEKIDYLVNNLSTEIIIDKTDYDLDSIETVLDKLDIPYEFKRRVISVYTTKSNIFIRQRIRSSS